MRVELAFHVRRAIERRELLVAKRRQMFDLEEQVRQQTLIIRRTQEETIYRLISASAGVMRKRAMCAASDCSASYWPPQPDGPHSDAEDLRMAAPMHDVGKSAFPTPSSVSPAV